jgi:5-methylcytosine-specific restriction endonuclease McrA
MTDDTLKFCLRTPIPEIFDAARYLDAAVSAHLSGRHDLANDLIRLTNTPALRDYIESLWGAKSPYVSVREVANPRPYLAKDEVKALRMPGADLQRQLIDRDGYHCRFCGIPVIPVEVRKKLNEAYPDALPWGMTNASQHAAFQALWMQFDHVVPHARGGDNSLGNIVIACAGCNYSRMNWTLEEVGLQDPRERPPVRSMWDGLTRIL